MLRTSRVSSRPSWFTSRTSGELNWILGNHDGWNEQLAAKLLNPIGELEWPYHQHAAEVTNSGSVLIFDNGNYRAMPPEPALAAPESYSRAVEYLVDPQAMSVQQIWSYGPDQEIFYSPFISEADPLPQTGNILITDGGRTRDEDGRRVVDTRDETDSEELEQKPPVRSWTASTTVPSSS